MTITGPGSPRRPSLAAAAALVILGGVRGESSSSRCAIARSAAAAATMTMTTTTTSSSFVVVPGPAARSAARRRRRDDDRHPPHSSHSSSLVVTDASSSSIDGGRAPLPRVGNFIVVDDLDGATGVGGGAVPPSPGVDDNNDDDGASLRPSSLVKRVEGVPIGMLTRKDERNILSVMRRLSSDTGRRRDDVVIAGRGGRNDGDDDAAPDARRRRQDAMIVEKLLDRLLEEWRHIADIDDVGHTRDDVTRRARMAHNLAIRAWANAGVRGSAERTERLLKRMSSSHENDGVVGGGPDVFSFAHCYAAWYRESLFGATRTTDDDDSRSSTLAMRRAENVLSSMKRLLMRHDWRKEPSSDRTSNMVEDVNSLLATWSTTNVDLPELSEKFLRFLADQCEVGGSSEVWVNERSYNLVINGEFFTFCHRNNYLTPLIV
jgi:hypothetical protein